MKIIAHRGARAEEPENTLRAIKRAFECDADAVEIDVRLSKDHKIVEAGMGNSIIISSLPVFPVKIAIDASANVIFPKYPRLNHEISQD